jgi:hypothetical protein
MPASMSLVLMLGISAYYYGRRAGRPWTYVLLSIPLALVSVVAVYVLTAQFV